MAKLENSAVLFDLDGTFIDTAADITAALNHAIASVGMKPFAVEEAKYFVGKGVAFMLARAFAEAGEDLEPELHKALTERLLDYYIANIARHSRPFAGALEAVAALKAEGALVGMCTNKLIDPARQLLQELDIADVFDVVTGGDTFSVKKPDPEHLRQTFALAPARKHWFMVGDTVNDFAAAKGAPALAIGVRFGYGTAADLAEADVLIDHFDELPALVAAHSA